MKKIGKSSASIFSPTGAGASPSKQMTQTRDKPQKPPSPRGRGRPIVHNEDWTKVTVVLLDRQILFLDRLALDIRAKTKTVVKRAEIIRALVDALDDSNLDLTTVETTQEMKTLLAQRMSV